MPLTPTPLYCYNCVCQQLKTRKSYTLRGRSSESRTGENPTYGLTRGLRVRIYGED